jgi:hypothetical protein
MDQIAPPRQRTRRITIVALDPSFRVKQGGSKRILTTEVEVPAEVLAPGPSGYRVQVIDYDASTNTLYKPSREVANGVRPGDLEDSQILSDPHFHARNVYAIIMRTLARFEFALGRRVSWGFYGHQLKVAPHAFVDANAFYTEGDQALMFGYFPGRKGMVFTCLSHHIVAHETTHALLDGLRQRYTDPSSPEQAAFHEGFADVVALLSIFSLRDVVRGVIDLRRKGRGGIFSSSQFVSAAALTPEKLRHTVLLGLAEEMGQELSGVRGNALRRSATLTPNTRYMDDPEFREPHRRGELLVAAVINAFIEVWVRRLRDLGRVSPRGLNRDRVVEEGAEVADYLLTMTIRALDYAPPVDLQFCDYLSALLTADREIRPDDSKYNFRKALLESFDRYKMPPTSTGDGDELGVWGPPRARMTYERTHFESMQRDPNEVFRFIWENRKELELFEDAYTRVQSVRPCLRIGPDGFALKETVAEYIQMIELQASELRSLGIRAPASMPADTAVKIYGGGALVFDEYGLLKFHVNNRILDPERQTKRLKYLWEHGHIQRGSSLYRRISHMHRLRALGLAAPTPNEE